MERRKSYSLSRLLDKGEFRAVELFENSKHEIGKTYWCGYWNMYYTVTDIEDDWIYCAWQDGKCNSHLTPLNWRQDWELVKI